MARLPIRPASGDILSNHSLASAAIVAERVRALPIGLSALFFRRQRDHGLPFFAGDASLDSIDLRRSPSTEGIVDLFLDDLSERQHGATAGVDDDRI